MEGALEPIKYTTEKLTINGNVNTVTILIIAVNDIDRAVSPLASLVIILDVTPPGQQDKIIIPTASSFVSLNIIIMQNVTKGRITVDDNDFGQVEEYKRIYNNSLEEKLNN